MAPSIDPAQRGVELHRQGHLVEAQAIYQQVLETEPDQPTALHYLGLIAHQLGRSDLARELMMRSLARGGQNLEFLCNYGEVCRKLGRLDEATKVLFQAVSLSGTYETLTNLGLVLQDQGRLEEALHPLERALELRPQEFLARLRVAEVLQGLHRYLEAISAWLRVLEIPPRSAEAMVNLAAAYQGLGEHQTAIHALREAIALKPTLVAAWINLGAAHGALEERIESERAYRKALELDPGNAEAHWNLSLLLLQQGQWYEGFEHYEWRWQAKAFTSPRKVFSCRNWQGETLYGKKLLIHCEQGLGDTLQFCRFATQLASQAREVILEVQSDLKPLLSGLGCTVVTNAADRRDLDFHIPMLSLPYRMGLNLQTLPPMTPYIHAKPELLESWRRRLSDFRFKVGLVWAGNPSHVNDRQRSMSLQDLAGLAPLAGRNIHFFSLQKGPAAAEARYHRSWLEDLSGELTSWDQTAGVLGALDLIISVDTAVVHLAGAMGRQTWVMLPKVGDFRWLLDTTSSPWYPTLRLWRQSHAGHWSGVVEAIRQELANE